MAKTVLTQVFDQLKMQVGEDEFSQMFDEAFWLEREREEIEEAYKDGVTGMLLAPDYYNSKYKGDKVVMHGCAEADLPKYKNKVWSCRTDSYIDKAGQEVVF